MRFSRRLAVSVALGITVMQTGCSSIKSTLLERDATNTGWTSLKTCGVPVTLKVITHLRVTVTENRLFTMNMKESKWVPLEDAQGCAVTERSWAMEEIKTDKVFTVDFKRPAAGTIKYDAKFSNQYFTEFSNEVEDRTIAEISSAIQGIISVLPKKSGAPGGGETRGFTTGLPEIKRFPTVIAVAVFAVDEPNWELQMTDFLAQHLSAPYGSALGQAHPSHSYELQPGQQPNLPLQPAPGNDLSSAGTTIVPPAPGATQLSTPRVKVSSHSPRLSPQSTR
jgi:hypothetical protein